jgi:hypothetical protein
MGIIDPSKHEPGAVSATPLSADMPIPPGPDQDAILAAVGDEIATRPLVLLVVLLR